MLRCSYKPLKEGTMDYRERLRDIREDRDLTQAEIGRLLNKSQQGYSHIESGRAELKIDDLITLCRFYNLSADYVIGLVDKPVSFKRK
ncbi:MAG: helix-turn-helix transcriptional regulator [Oscillospiraceae bacterium]|nr:helix-turn-helix transcriptional regulator [Oscillospiraceae bacterium]